MPPYIPKELIPQRFFMAETTPEKVTVIGNRGCVSYNYINNVRVPIFIYKRLPALFPDGTETLPARCFDIWGKPYNLTLHRNCFQKSGRAAVQILAALPGVLSLRQNNSIFACCILF
jgi:hypothetical protein